MRQEHQELFRRYTATPFTEHYYSHQGGSLRYIKAGNGPAIILLHGANIGLIQWFPNIDALAKKYTVYAVDLPGAGESSPIHDRHDFQKTYLQPMRELIRHIGEPYAIVAHSFSAWIALQLSLQNVSFQKIVLSNPVGFFRKVPLKHLPLSSKKIAALLTKFIVKPSLPNMERFLQSVSRKQVDPLFVRAYYATISLGGHPFWFINSLMKHGRLKQELYLSETLNQSPPPIDSTAIRKT